MEMYSTEYLRYVIEEYMTLIQKHRKLLVLLFFHAQGSSLENFKENFTERSTSLVKEYFRDMKEKHPQMNINVTDFSIHLHTAWMFTMFEELIMHRDRKFGTDSYRIHHIRSNWLERAYENISSLFF